MGAAKALMGMIGVDVGQPRLPIAPLAPEQRERLRGQLESLGYFQWGRRM
jgi:N-acetylneuraminate lyase